MIETLKQFTIIKLIYGVRDGKVSVGNLRGSLNQPHGSVHKAESPRFLSSIFYGSRATSTCNIQPVCDSCLNLDIKYEEVASLATDLCQ